MGVTRWPLFYELKIKSLKFPTFLSEPLMIGLND